MIRAHLQRLPVQLSIVFIVSLALRLIYILQSRSSPFFYSLGLDSKFYDSWAVSLLEGRGWGGEAFFMSPLYPAVLAGLYSLFGRDLLAVRIFQAFLGAGTCMLIVLIARKVFGRWEGLVAGMMAAGYGAFILYDGSILATSILTFLYTLGLLFYLNGRELGSWKMILLSSLVWGLGALAKPNVLAVVPFLILFLHSSEDKKRMARLGLVFLAGLVLIIAPVTARNYALSGQFVFISSNGGINFFIGNHEGASGAYTKPPGVEPVLDPPGEGKAEAELGRELGPAEVSSYWSGKAMDFVTEDTGAWVRLMVKKAVLFFNVLEVPQIESYYFYKRFSSLLSLPLLGFGVLLPLAVFGWWRRRRVHEANILGVFVLAYAFSIIAFFVLSRYRLPVVPPLAVLAAGGVVSLLEALRGRALRVLVSGAAILGITGFIANYNFYGLDRSVSDAQFYYRLGIVYGERGELEEAKENYLESIERDPYYPKAHLNLGSIHAKLEENELAKERFMRALELDPSYSKAYVNLAAILQEEGFYEQSIQYGLEAARLAPEDPLARLLLGEGFLAIGDSTRAREEFLNVLRLDRSGVEALRARVGLSELSGDAQIPKSSRYSEMIDRGREALQKGDLTLAQEMFSQVLEADPSNVGALAGLGEAYIQAGVPERAILHLEKASSISPETPGIHFLLGLAYNSTGRHEEAIGQYEQELAINPDSWSAHFNLGLTHMNFSRNFDLAGFHLEAALSLGAPDSTLIRRLLDQMGR
jgi:tetratricopeptide (TPR) repeat protein